MEQEKCTVPYLSESKKQRSEVPAGEMSGDEDPTHGDASPEQEDASAEGSGGHGGVAVESDTEDPEEALAAGSEGIAVVGNVGRGTTSWGAENEDIEVAKKPLATRFRFRAAIAHPTPPTTYRRLPLRSRKQYSPTRFIAAGAAPAATRSTGVSATAMSTTDHDAMNEAQGSTVTCSALDATVDMSSCDESKSGTEATNAAASSSMSTSYRLPSRSRKQRLPDHFIPEEAEASARAKARRSSAALDRFLTSLLRVSPEQRPEWVRNVTADDGGGLGQGGVTAPGEGPEEPAGRARILTVLAVLAASLALCVISCVLFYIIGRRTEHGRKKVKPLTFGT